MSVKRSVPIEATITSIDPPTPSAQTDHIQALETLSLQSVDILLQSCRAQVELFAELLPTGLIQTASIFMRVLIATSQFLSEVPTNEQGYPADTLGGVGWTWPEKQGAVEHCVEGLYQLGWAWADVSEVLDTVMNNMERLTPTADQLAAWQRSSRDRSETGLQLKEMQVRAKAEQEKQEGDRAIKAAMRFWPPRSVPDIIDEAMAQLDISRDDAPDAIRLLKPWSPPDSLEPSPENDTPDLVANGQNGLLAASRSEQSAAPAGPGPASGAALPLGLTVMGMTNDGSNISEDVMAEFAASQQNWFKLMETASGDEARGTDVGGQPGPHLPFISGSTQLNALSHLDPGFTPLSADPSFLSDDPAGTPRHNGNAHARFAAWPSEVLAGSSEPPNPSMMNGNDQAVPQFGAENMLDIDALMRNQQSEAAEDPNAAVYQEFEDLLKSL